MTLLKVLSIPALIVIVGAVYWFLSYEAAGTAMLVIFGIAMALMSLVLVPTFGDVGPTAPVDAEWHEHGPESGHGNAGHCGCPGGRAANAVSGSLVLTRHGPQR